MSAAPKPEEVVDNAAAPEDDIEEIDVSEPQNKEPTMEQVMTNENPSIHPRIPILIYFSPW